MFRIGDLKIDPPLVLAPMAGITDTHFRSIIRQVGGVGLVSMEFISSESLTRGVEHTLNMIAFEQEERPLAIQIYGSNVERMAAAADIVEEVGADVCDINMGCPANKILKGCAGAALMGDLKLAGSIIAAVKKRLSMPLTVKFRAGLDDRRLNFLELGRICEGEGAAAVTIHPRTAKQFYSGRADWQRVRQLKETLKIPVIGNGDVTSPGEAAAMLRDTGCDGVMIGRGSLQNPWIFRQTAALLAGAGSDEVAAHGPTLQDRRALILHHFDRLRSREEEKHALHRIRTFTGWYTHGLPNGRSLRQRISGLKEIPEFLAAVEEFFDRGVPSVEDLRPPIGPFALAAGAPGRSDPRAPLATIPPSEPAQVS